jgi:hypothetical protein
MLVFCVFPSPHPRWSVLIVCSTTITNTTSGTLSCHHRSRGLGARPCLPRVAARYSQRLYKQFVPLLLHTSTWEIPGTSRHQGPGDTSMLSGFGVRDILFNILSFSFHFFPVNILDVFNTTCMLELLIIEI